MPHMAKPIEQASGTAGLILPPAAPSALRIIPA